MSSTHRVASLNQLSEEEGLRVVLDGVALAVYRRGENVFAVTDACPHMGASLSEGYLDGDAVVCPWHGWLFSLTDGTSPFDEEARIAVYRAWVEQGDVFVDVSAETRTPGTCPGDVCDPKTGTDS